MIIIIIGIIIIIIIIITRIYSSNRNQTCNLYIGFRLSRIFLKINLKLIEKIYPIHQNEKPIRRFKKKIGPFDFGFTF